jgi:hypothetical protein
MYTAPFHRHFLPGLFAPKHICLVALLLCIGSFGAVGQTIRYVKPVASGTGNGSSWANASSDINAMITASSAGNQVWVAAGLYKPTTTTDRTLSFGYKAEVSLYGGFAGTETNLSSRTLTYPSSTTLSGDIGVVGDPADNSYAVIRMQATAAAFNSTFYDGFVITGGNANNTSTVQQTQGGGIHIRGVAGTVTVPVVRNCLITNNRASFWGAGVYVASNTSTQFVNCVFQQNTALQGGGIALDGTGTSATITNCAFTSNTATSGGSGAAIYQNGATTRPKVDNSILFGNVGSAFTTATSGTLPALVRYSILNSTAPGTYSNVVGNTLTTTSPFSSTSPVAQVNLCGGGANAGDPASTTATLQAGFDILGNPRLVGGRVDIGPFEFQGAGVPSVVAITTQPVETTVCPNEVFSFSVATSGSVANYTWVYISTDIANSNSPVLSLTAAAPYSANTAFRVRVTGPCNVVNSNQAALRINTGGMTSIATGNWNDPAIWSCRRVPVVTDQVTVGHVVTIPAAFTARAAQVRYIPNGRIRLLANTSRFRTLP